MASDFNSTTQFATHHPSADGWTLLATASAEGTIDGWDIYLMARQITAGIALDVFGEALLGEIPREWYDVGGELLPKYCTEEGDIRLPEVFNGKPVTGHDNEYILGDIKPCGDNTQIVLPSLDLDDIYDALEQLGWDVDDLEEVQDELEVTFGPADVEISNHGSLVLFCPRTPDARAWLTENVEGGALWSGSQLVVEHRFAKALIEGLHAEGFRTGR